MILRNIGNNKRVCRVVVYMEDIDLTDTEGASDFELYDMDVLGDQLDDVPEWVDESSDTFCEIVSFDPENPRFILTVSRLLDEYYCQVVYVTEGAKCFVYIVPTENEFVTFDM